MAPRVSSLRALWWVMSLALAAALVGPSGARAQSSTGCENRVNDTPSKLVECIRTDDLWKHMQAFQAIADANPGADGHPSRNSGEPGYRASVEYVASWMRAAGYDVPIQPYTFLYFSFLGTPSFREISPTAHDYGFNTEWGPGASTGVAAAAT